MIRFSLVYELLRYNFRFGIDRIKANEFTIFKQIYCATTFMTDQLNIAICRAISGVIALSGWSI